MQDTYFVPFSPQVARNETSLLLVSGHWQSVQTSSNSFFSKHSIKNFHLHALIIVSSEDRLYHSVVHRLKPNVETYSNVFTNGSRSLCFYYIIYGSII